MAANFKQGNATFAFTLPISCQICFGKVKSPTTCPNQHVFCSSCMDVWLERNQQCPACRVAITAENPCKKILGGLNHGEDSQEKSTPQLRRARMELLYKDFEDEITRLQKQVDTLSHENNVLHKQLNQKIESQVVASSNHQGAASSGQPSSREGERQPRTGSPDHDMLLILTKKLQDAGALYDKVKVDTKKLKQENNSLKDENVNQSRENQRLRVEIANRSPQRYGRYTMAALQTKLETYEKEVKQLQRALERSDAYIEDTEEELEKYRKGIKNPSGDDGTSKRDTSLETLKQDRPKSLLSDTLNTSSPPVGKAKRNLFRLDSDNDSASNSPIEKRPLRPGTGGADSRSAGITNFYGGSAQKKEKELLKPSPWKRFRSDSDSRDVDDSSASSLYFENKKEAKKSTATGASNCTSFEMPSPLTPASSLGRLTLGGGDTPEEKSMLSSISGATSMNSSSRGKSARKELKFGFGQKAPPTVTSSSSFSAPSQGSHTSSFTGSHTSAHAGSHTSSGSGSYAGARPKERQLMTDASCSSNLRNVQSHVKTQSGGLDFGQPPKGSEPLSRNPRDTEAPYSFGWQSVPSTSKGLQGKTDFNDISDTIDFNSTRAINVELDDLDITVTPEISDCLKLFNAAEKKVEKRRAESSDESFELPSTRIQSSLAKNDAAVTSSVSMVTSSVATALGFSWRPTSEKASSDLTNTTNDAKSFSSFQRSESRPSSSLESGTRPRPASSFYSRLDSGGGDAPARAASVAGQSSSSSRTRYRTSEARPI